MAERQEPDLTPDELTERLAPDPSQPPDATVLTGFLGRSALEAHQRLYLDETLTNYVEIPEEAILERRQVGSEGSPHGRSTTLWVRRGTQLQHTVADSRQVQAEFLQGDITGALGAGAPPAAALPAALRRPPWSPQSWGFECDPRRGTMVSCSRWCSWTEDSTLKCRMQRTEDVLCQ